MRQPLSAERAQHVGRRLGRRLEQGLELGARLLRRLGPDEELSETDMRPPDRRLVPVNWRAADAPVAVEADYVPSSVTSAILANLAVLTGKIADLQVTTVKRSDVATFSGGTHNILPNGYASGTFNHGVGKLGVVTPMSQNSVVFIGLTQRTTFSHLYRVFNSDPTGNQTCTPIADLF